MNLVSLLILRNGKCVDQNFKKTPSNENRMKHLRE